MPNDPILFDTPRGHLLSLLRMFRELFWPVRYAEGFRQMLLGLAVVGGTASAAVALAVVSTKGLTDGFWGSSSLAILLALFAFGAGAYRLVRTVEANEIKTPMLSLSSPYDGPGQTYPGEEPIRLYRIKLENLVPNSLAANVRVRCSVDAITLPTFDVHETHENRPPFRRERSVRHGEPIDFDLLAKRDDHYQLYFVRSDIGDHYFYQLSHEEHDAIQNAYFGEGFVIRIAVVADPPVKFSQPFYEYRVRYRDKQSLDLTLVEPSGVRRPS